MTIDPAVLIGFIAAILSLLGLFLRAFASGSLMSRTVVPREDYERVITINEGYAAKFGEQSEAVRTLAATVERLVSIVEGRAK